MFVHSYKDFISNLKNVTFSSTKSNKCYILITINSKLNEQELIYSGLFTAFHVLKNNYQKQIKSGESIDNFSGTNST